MLGMASSESHENSLKRCSDELAWRLDQASQVGVVYAVEPVGSKN